MPKQKLRKSVTKRFKVTKNGKIMHRHNFSRHLRVKKSESAKRQQKRQTVMTGYYARKLRKYLGIHLKSEKKEK